jgi:hypothetical protein
MFTHTKEPWRLLGSGIFDAKVYEIVDPAEDRTGELPENWEADSRRIVACVNFCRDIATEQLEKGLAVNMSPYGYCGPRTGDKREPLPSTPHTAAQLHSLIDSEQPETGLTQYYRAKLEELDSE